MAGPVRTKDELQQALAALEREHGPWTYDIPLPFGVWTKGNQGLAHTRLKRLVQAAADVAGKPLAQCRVLDLACLDGQFAIEFGLHGAQAVGIEIRPSHVAKARFAAQALGLDNVAFHEDDVRNLSEAKYGRFDIVVCSGILYHLAATDAINLVYAMFDVAERAVIIDTQYSPGGPETVHTPKGRAYRGESFREHDDGLTEAQKQARGWASWDNTTSFWFSRASLVNLLQHAGFTAVYEGLAPVHLNYGQPGLESAKRVTLVATKSRAIEVKTSPAADPLREEMPEDAEVAAFIASAPQRAAAAAAAAAAAERQAAAQREAPATPKRRGLLARVLREVAGRRE